MADETKEKTEANPSPQETGKASQEQAKSYTEAEMSVMLKRAESAEAKLKKAQGDNQALRKLEWYTGLDEEEREKFYVANTSQEKYVATAIKRYGLDDTAKKFLGSLSDPEEIEELAQRLSGKFPSGSETTDVDKALADMGVKRQTSAAMEKVLSPSGAALPLLVSPDQGIQAYQSALKSGEPLPSSSEIDAMTAKFLQAHS